MVDAAYVESDLPLRDHLRTILESYAEARQSQPFAGTHEISVAFRGIKELAEQSAPVTTRPDLSVVASYGKGNWATIPWLSVLDGRETSTTQRGIYVVYLFSEGGDGVYLALAQGITEFESFNRVKAREMLRQRADAARSKILGVEEAGFDLSGAIDLRSKHSKARMYEQSTIASKYYAVNALPSDEELLADLDVALQAYDSLVTARMSASDHRKIALVGTWGAIRRDIADVRRGIQADGAWASPWSFKLKEDARSKLVGGFTLFINGGAGIVVARAFVAEYACSDNSAGMLSPWPQITSEDRQITRLNDSVHGGIKTWLKLESIDMIEPIRVDQLEPVDGLSTAQNVVNQNAFGYVYEREFTVVEAAGVGEAESTGEVDEELELSTEWLAGQTLLSADVLAQMVETLQGTQPQIILAGPPGTSKTWVAQRLAKFITRGRKNAVRLVQFHPSYTYEAFIEGLRPSAGPAGVSFEITAGVVLQTVQRMREAGHLNDPRYPYVIIIDEANRANLPRVMGELLFLLEYRNESISLQLTKDFQLPTNLVFIATMNTADRSIRSIDAAMRRRFEIFDLPPSSEVLERYHAQQGSEGRELAIGLAKLNEHLTANLDRHHTIGHSFFMRSDMSPTVLGEVWRRKLLPLIEEYYFDQPDTTRQLSVQQFWPDYVE